MSTHKRAHRSIDLLAPIAAGLIAAGCGGGSSGDDDTSITWEGNSNGSVVLDARNQQFTVRASDGAVYDVRRDEFLGGARVDDDARLILSGSVIGAVVPAAGTNGSRVAVFGCAGGGGMTILNDDAGWSYRCPPTVVTDPGQSTTVGGSPTASFVRWQGSDNGSFVVDADGDGFQVDASTRELFHPDSGTRFGNAFVDGSAVVSIGGAAVGSVQLRPGERGGQVAALVCNGGLLMDIVVTSSGTTYSCDSGASWSGLPAPPPSGAPPSGVTFTQRGRYITTTTPNGFEVEVVNTSPFSLFCAVIADYEYPNSRGGLDPGSRTNHLRIPQGASGRTTFSLLGVNLRVNAFRTTCQRD